MSRGEFEEFGVNFTRNKKLAKELGYREFHYLSEHTSTNNKFNKTVYCVDREAFNRLIREWNKIDNRWKHTEK